MPSSRKQGNLYMFSHTSIIRGLMGGGGGGGGGCNSVRKHHNQLYMVMWLYVGMVANIIVMHVILAWYS